MTQTDQSDLLEGQMAHGSRASRFPDASEWEQLALLDYATRGRQESIEDLRDAADTFRMASQAVRDLAWERRRMEAFSFDHFAIARVTEAGKAFERLHKNVTRLRAIRNQIVKSIINDPRLCELLPVPDKQTGHAIVDVESLERIGIAWLCIADELARAATVAETAARALRKGSKGEFPDVSSYALLDYAKKKQIGERKLVRELVSAVVAFLTRHNAPAPDKDEAEAMAAKWENDLKAVKHRRAQRR